MAEQQDIRGALEKMPGLRPNVQMIWPWGLRQTPESGGQDVLVTVSDPAAFAKGIRGTGDRSLLNHWADAVVAASDLGADEMELHVEDIAKSMKLGKKDARAALLKAAGTRTEAMGSAKASLRPSRWHGGEVEEVERTGGTGALEDVEGLADAVAKAQRREGQVKLAEPILKDPMAALDAALSKQGRVGERAAAKAVFLATVSSYLKTGINLVVKAQSSSGKSHTVKGVFALVPKGHVRDFSSMSPRAIIYDEPGAYSHRTVFLEEGEALVRKGDDQNPVAEMLRVLLSEKMLKHATVERDPDSGRLQTRWLTQDGPTNLITTTTRGHLDAEIETRVVSIWLDESPAQTAAIINAAADAAATGDAQELNDLDRETWGAYFDVIWSGARGVVVPFARHVGLGMPSDAVRARRDFNTILAFIKASAIAHRPDRQVDASGRLVAEVKDYAIALDCIGHAVEQAHELTISDNARTLLEALRDKVIEPACAGTQHPDGSGASLWDAVAERPVVLPVPPAQPLVPQGQRTSGHPKGLGAAYEDPDYSGAFDVVVSGSARDLAKSLGIPKSSIHRYVAHCEAEGLIDRLDDKKKGARTGMELRVSSDGWDAVASGGAAQTAKGLPTAAEIEKALKANGAASDAVSGGDPETENEEDIFGVDDTDDDLSETTVVH